MSDPAPTPLLQTLRWLATHAGFPAWRLPERAELLLLIAAAAAGQGRESAPAPVGRPGPARNFNARIRGYTIQRRHAHMKSDNSAKV